MPLSFFIVSKVSKVFSNASPALVLSFSKILDPQVSQASEQVIALLQEPNNDNN